MAAVLSRLRRLGTDAGESVTIPRSAYAYAGMTKNLTQPPPKADDRAQVLWHEVALASDEIARLVDNIPGLTVTGAETRSELERAAALLRAVSDILRRTQRRESARHAPANRSILGPDPLP